MTGCVVSSNSGNPCILRRSWTGSGPVEIAFVKLDLNVVDARLPPPHQSLLVKLPEFVAIGPEPLTVEIVVFLLEADRYSVVGETPQ